MNLKNIIIGVLAVTTIASTTTSIYFGLNQETKAEQDTSVELSVQDSNEKVNDLTNSDLNSEDIGYEKIFKSPNEINVVNTQDHYYNIQRYSAPTYGVYACLEDSNTVAIIFERKMDNDYFKNYENYINLASYIRIDFGNRNVQNVYNCGTGHTGAANNILFLMEDGTVEYMPLAYAIYNNDFRSYGKIEGVENVVDIVTASTRTSEPASGYITTLLIQKDGTAYDISEQLNKIYEQYSVQ